jgi:branched-chain amino acid transport system substrate-binding protein
MGPRRAILSIVTLALAAGGLLGAGVPPAGAASKEVVIGMQCDRVGPTNTIGPFFCAGVHDYVKLINKKGGVEGLQVRAFEIDIKYEVPLAVEAYQRHKQEGAVSIMLYGTPQTYALLPKLTEDKIPGTSPGFGKADAADGTRYPYLFPIAATYWSQATASVKYIMDQVKGKRPLKIAYLYYDNPAGKEPIPVLEKLAKKEGFELKTWAVPPPGIEMSAQVLDIAQRYRADWVITHLFGRSPSVSIKEMKRVGFKMDHVIAFVWGTAESDIDAAGRATAEGYLGLQFAGAGTDFPVHGQIVEMYKAEGKEPPKEMARSVYYNRGILHAAVHVEAIRNAAKLGGPITGEKMKRGLESIKGLTLGGLMPPMEITPQDHEGGGWVRIYQVKALRWVSVTDWFKAYPEIIAEELKEAAAKAK